MSTPQTWHYGLVSEWWAQFNVDGLEIEYYGRFVAAGQPALDAGCGTGRLLVPWLRAGYDVDGADLSGDMLARCRERARAEGFEPLLLEQPLHELDPPRRYRTVVVCGVFGLGSTREQDEEALWRLRGVLEPGGTLLLDHGVPYGSKGLWELWTSEGRATLPQPFPEHGERKSATDGTEYELRSRVVALDPLDESVLMELRVDKRCNGVPVASDVHDLSMRMYLGEELRLLLGRAGFSHVEVRGGFSEREPTPDTKTLVYIATRGA